MFLIISLSIVYKIIVQYLATYRWKGLHLRKIRTLRIGVYDIPGQNDSLSF